jgi:hypothetical protein
VLVGSDGVVLESFRYRRFIPYSEIECIRHNTNFVVLVLRDGSELELPVWKWSGQALPQDPAGRSFLSDRAEARDYRAALLSHLKRARARALQGAASDSATIPLRDGRSPDEWRTATRRAMSEGYRRAAPTVQGLLDIVGDARAPQEARVGAVLALSDVEDAELSAELRQAIDHCASLRLRVALDQASRDELDVEVLAALDDEVRPVRAVERA